MFFRRVAFYYLARPQTIVSNKVNRMSQNVRQDISALMDGDLAGSAADGAIKALKTESALKATWARYHVARSAMKREYTPYVKSDLLGRVQAALESDPVFLNAGAHGEPKAVEVSVDEPLPLPLARPRYRVNPYFAMATAASVAVGSFIALEMAVPTTTLTNAAGVGNVAAVQSAPALPVSTAPAKISPHFQAQPAPVVLTQAGPVASDQWRRLEAGDVPRLEHYLSLQELSAPDGDVQSGLFPSARVVSFGPDAAK